MIGYFFLFRFRCTVKMRLGVDQFILLLWAIFYRYCAQYLLPRNY
jgi:hypothetical protein